MNEETKQAVEVEKQVDELQRMIGERATFEMKVARIEETATHIKLFYIPVDDNEVNFIYHNYMVVEEEK